MDRRVSIKWILAAASAGSVHVAAAAYGQSSGGNRGYGTDPDLRKVYTPGQLWPLTLNPAQRRMAATLCDLVIPADGRSPSASAVGVVDFLDEWVSAPYPQQTLDRKIILNGLRWLDAESRRRFGADFVDLVPSAHDRICKDICYLPTAKPRFVAAAKFFARYRDLTAGGFYTSAQGMADLGYIGNVPRASYDGPPIEVLAMLGLA